MAAYLNMDTLRFLLQHTHDLEQILTLPRFEDHDMDSINIMLDAIKDFSDQELYPVFREMDEQPVHYADGKIITHPALGKILRQSAELGVIGGTFDYEDGGLQLPNTVGTATYFIMDAANNNVPGYTGLTMGSAELILHFGSEELKATYVPHMISGEWGGTMCLTEPQAGSSLSDITTTAYPQADGTYKIKGQKIFISGGDHEHCENFVHLVLARIEGAPAGTKGISLFVVPKYRPTDAGLVHNDVITAGDFQKMGQRGYCTTHLSFGEEDNCTGFLVGQPHRGLGYMFLMMNGARIGVGRGGVAIASAAYHASLQYAQERPQGRRILDNGRKDPNESPTLIIEHADVRRMLFLQKAIYEGGLSLVLQSSKYLDLSLYGPEEEREKYKMLLDILTPITKTFPAEKGREAVDNGLQILGGYGFCSDFVLQQYYRDIRIFAIYEGTTGIQSLDLLSRKVTMHNGKALELLAGEMKTTIQAALQQPELQKYAAALGGKIKETQEVLGFLLPYAAKGEYERFLADANIFMEYFSTLVVAWQWLQMGVTAKQLSITGAGNFTDDYLEGILHTMRFYFTYEVPKMNGLVEIMRNEEELTLLKEKAHF
ncbi:acyl-CoA dehydrogenase [Lewinella sp. LCG006]|uniref:acyl-CoA dehydrogenase n=1 Tax=Lewinella sp. LCG006 TaxID=3231911 RepID=UPI00345F5646